MEPGSIRPRTFDTAGTRSMPETTERASLTAEHRCSTVLRNSSKVVSEACGLPRNTSASLWTTEPNDCRDCARAPGGTHEIGKIDQIRIRPKPRLAPGRKWRLDVRGGPLRRRHGQFRVPDEFRASGIAQLRVADLDGDSRADILDTSSGSVFWGEPFTPNRPPTADAGPDVTIGETQQVRARTCVAEHRP